MDDEKILRPDRIRTNEGSFAFIPHRFLRGGFFPSCRQDELCLYLFFVLAADRRGVSYYGRGKLSKLAGMEPEKIREALRGLRRRDLIETDGTNVQVLSLPAEPVRIERMPTAAGLVDARKAFHLFVEQLSKGQRP
jgi:hypothetical protein